MYFILSNELTDEDNDACLSGNTNLDLGGNISFERGLPVPTIPTQKIILTLDNDSKNGKMTDHLSIDEIYGLVFSLRLRELLFSFMVDNVQYFDLDIIDKKNNKIYTDYKVANVVGVVDCINKSKSDITCYADGDIKYVDSLILDESKIPKELKIFRLSEYRIALVIHQSIKDAIVASGITGCVFYKPEEYS